MKKRVGFYLILILLIFPVIRCQDFLETRPYGTTTYESLSSNLDGAESLLISAYSMLDGFAGNFLSDLDIFAEGAASNWVFGSVHGADAYKGSKNNKDQKPITDIETELVLPSNIYVEGKWRIYYDGINRANTAIRAFKGLKDISEDLRMKRLGEARFLRGFYHFELRKIFGNVPYIDENTEDVRVGNKAEIFPRIQEDLSFAAANLPLSQPEYGRITQGAANAYLGISWMWLHDYPKAKAVFDQIITSGRYSLNKTYHENFNAEFHNTQESILEVQQSVNDGSDGLNGNVPDWLNFPTFLGSGFHQPSQNLVNAFKTDVNGLPLLDSYNDSDITNDDGLISTDPFTPYTGNVDPRLDWTVGRRGIPYLDWGIHPGNDWVRMQSYGGPYSPKKNVYYQAQQKIYTQDGWGSTFNANNVKLLRYADLLLYAAEAEAELGNLSAALDYVNLVRKRAANPAGFVFDGINPAANYYIKPYLSFPDKTYARKAIRFERRIELGMEGHRFFDLVRWGVAASEKNAYFAVEKTKRDYLNTAKFVENKNEYMPIPQKAILMSNLNGKPTLEQNSGY